MKFTVAGYSASLTSVSLVPVAALTDNIVRAVGNNIIVPRGFNRLFGAYVLGPNVADARLRSPSIDSGRYQRLRPLDFAAIPSSPCPIDLFLDNMLELTETEIINLEVANVAAGANRATGLLFLSDGTKDAAPAGEIITVKATSATTLVANAWTDCVLTFTDSLVAGRYALGGARVEGATAQAFRFFPGDVSNYRPGGIACATQQAVQRDEFQNFGLGTWFEFEHDTPPILQVLANAADTAQTAFLDLIYLGQSK